MLERIPSRFVSISPKEYMVVGLSYKPNSSLNMESESRRFDFSFKIGDVDQPIDIISELHVSEVRIIN